MGIGKLITSVMVRYRREEDFLFVPTAISHSMTLYVYGVPDVLILDHRCGLWISDASTSGVFNSIVKWATMSETQGAGAPIIAFAVCQRVSPLHRDRDLDSAMLLT